jgi:hypothetical protein
LLSRKDQTFRSHELINIVEQHSTRFSGNQKTVRNRNFVGKIETLLEDKKIEIVIIALSWRTEELQEVKRSNWLVMMMISNMSREKKRKTWKPIKEVSK